MAGVNPEIPGLPSAQSQLMAAAAAMQGASALSYLGLGNPSMPGGMLSNAFSKYARVHNDFNYIFDNYEKNKQQTIST